MKSNWQHKSKVFEEPVTIANEGRNIDIEVHRQYRGKMIMEIMDKLFEQGLLKPEAKALDVGSNTGSFTQVIAHYFNKPVTGIDPEKEFIDKGNSNYPNINFIESTIEDFNPGEKFDFIMCLEVIEHCQDQQQVVKKIYSLMADDGIALVSMPNKINAIYSSANMLDKSGLLKVRDDVRLHFRFTPHDIESLFTNNGFKIIYRTGFNIFVYRFLARVQLFNAINWWMSKLPLLRKFTQYYHIVVKKA